MDNIQIEAKIISLPNDIAEATMEEYFEALASHGVHESDVKLQFLVEAMDQLAETRKVGLPQIGDTNGLSFEFEVEVDGVVYHKHMRTVDNYTGQPVKLYLIRASIGVIPAFLLAGILFFLFALLAN